VSYQIFYITLHVEHVVAGTALVSIKGVHRARLVVGSVTVGDLCMQPATQVHSPLYHQWDNKMGCLF